MDRKPILITGGAGFVGINLADRLLTQNRTVRIIDNLSKDGAEDNLNWLCEKHRSNIQIISGDILHFDLILKAVKNVEAIFHLASQSSIATSMVNPNEDFLTNVKGTLNVLEAVKNSSQISNLIYTSTNKVYGSLEDLNFSENEMRYELNDKKYNGLNEERPLIPNSPYSCSKASADFYVHNYFYSFNIPTTIVRLSSIYGPHQVGSEDQGWIAHIIKSILEGNIITLYGSGKQIRDILHVNDLLSVFDKLLNSPQKAIGKIFNIGGGKKNIISPLELIAKIEKLSGISSSIMFDEPRIGDQQFYISDISKISQTLSWTPEIDVQKGVEDVYHYYKSEKEEIEKTSKRKPKEGKTTTKSSKVRA